MAQYQAGNVPLGDESLAAAFDERGTSLVELMVVCLLAGVVSLTTVESMVTTSETTMSIQDRSQTMDDVRYALEMLERDIRAANPIEVAAATSDYDSNVSFAIYCADAGVGDCGDDNLRAVTWRRAGNALERVAGGSASAILHAEGPPSLAESQRRAALVNPSNRPLFRYYDATGTLMPTSGVDALPPEQFRACAKEVRITLIVNAESDPAPRTIELQTSATLRNFHAVAGC